MTQKMSCAEALDQPRSETPPDLPVVLVVAAALVDQDGRVLLAQRPEGKSMAGLWEFPGGKVKEGETPEFALVREIEEELGIETREGCYTPIAFASHSYDDFHLLMPLFACRAWKGEVTAIEHQEIKWVKPQDMGDYPMPEADIPLIASLRDLL
ncbi:MAG: NTP pyrophosphohydrolase [Micavibrio sp.]|nr:MAG: NTP pyrophosphohydrolase [Micavibrio sp.]